MTSLADGCSDPSGSAAARKPGRPWTGPELRGRLRGDYGRFNDAVVPSAPCSILLSPLLL